MPANCDRHIWGPLPWPPLQSLHRGGYYCHPRPRSTADGGQQASAHGQAGALASGQFLSLRILVWESVSGSVAEAGGQQNRGLQAGRAREPGGPRQREGSEGGKGIGWSAGATCPDFLQARPSAFP